MLRSGILTVVLLALSQSGFAQLANPPGAGGQIQQIPLSPIPERAIPQIRVEQGGTPAVPTLEQTRIAVKSLRVTGQTLYSEADLVALTGFSAGTELTLTDLRAMAAKIADYYRKNGYFVAQAYLPAQDIKDGVVTIAVLEGRYGSITLRNQSTLSDSVVNGLVEGLNRGDIIAITPLENRLLLLSDIPGVVVKSTLVPGSATGTSDLLIDVTPGQRISGNVEADNAGNRYTGAYRVGGTVNFNNLTGIGDVASLRGITSGSGLMYGRASYQRPFGKATVGVAYTALKYRLGREFSNLNANGTAQIVSLYGTYPLIRSRDSNLYALMGFDAKTFQDKVDSTATVTDKKARVFMAGLYGNHRDNLAGGGVSRYSLTWSSGVIDIRTPAALAADAVAARSNGRFDKLAFYGSRVQNVTQNVSLSAALNGQVASKNLDISEKMSLGGMYGVRAYPVGEAYGDEGYLLNLEARLRLPTTAERVPGQFHLIGFIDTGTVTINKTPWAAGQNRRTLSGAGVGATWADYNNFSINAYYAWKLGNAVATSAPDANGRFWIQGVKYF